MGVLEINNLFEMFQLFLENQISQLVEWLIVPVLHKLPWQKSYYFWGSSRSLSISQVRFLDNAVLFLLFKIRVLFWSIQMLPELPGELIKWGLSRGWCDREVVQALHLHRSGYGLVGGKRVEIDCADGYTTLNILKKKPLGSILWQWKC